MEAKTKIHLSTLEKDLLADKEWILTKRAVMDKVVLLWGRLGDRYREILKDPQTIPHVMSRACNGSGKISKGENYLGLPYAILDFPAVFSKEDVFAVRSFMWWGNFFSITLHVAGESFSLYRPKGQGTDLLKEKSFFVGIQEDPWRHDFSPDNYQAASQKQAQEVLQSSSRNFLKVSRKLDIAQWDQAESFFEESFLDLIEFVRISFPGGERGL